MCNFKGKCWNSIFLQNVIAFSFGCVNILWRLWCDDVFGEKMWNKKEKKMKRRKEDLMCVCMVGISFMDWV